MKQAPAGSKGFEDANPLIDLEIDRLLCQRDFLHFGREAFQHVHHSDYVHGKHFEVLARHLQAVADKNDPVGRISRLLVNQPPSTGKSYWTTQTFVPWIWTWWPQCRVLNFSYQAGRGTKDSELARTLIKSKWYQERFEDVYQMSVTDDSKTFYRNTHGGWRMTSYPGGPATGEHPDIIVIDDPISADTVRYINVREFIRTWYFETIPSRGIGRDAAHVISQQRLHPDDLSGHVRSFHKKMLDERGHSPWHIITLPMRYRAKTHMADRGYGGDWRTKEGELLYPELLGEAAVGNLEMTLRMIGPWAVDAQLAQDPGKADGKFFKCSNIKIITAEELPLTFDSLVRFWDMAGTEDGGCNTAGVLVGKKGKSFYVLDVIAQQLNGDDVEALIEQTAKLDMVRYTDITDGIPVVTLFEREGGSSGKRVAEVLERRWLALGIEGRSPDKDKVTRAGPIASLINSGDFYVLQAPWTAAYIDELEKFPGTGLKDRVDGTSGAVMEILLPQKKTTKGKIAIAAQAQSKGKWGEHGPCRCQCKRPAFSDSGYCCEECKRTSEAGLPVTHTPQCAHLFNDWWMKHN